MALSHYIMFWFPSKVVKWTSNASYCFGERASEQKKQPYALCLFVFLFISIIIVANMAYLLLLHSTQRSPLISHMRYLYNRKWIFCSQFVAFSVTLRRIVFGAFVIFVFFFISFSQSQPLNFALFFFVLIQIKMLVDSLSLNCMSHFTMDIVFTNVSVVSTKWIAASALWSVFFLFKTVLMSIYLIAASNTPSSNHNYSVWSDFIFNLLFLLCVFFSICFVLFFNFFSFYNFPSLWN